MYLRRETSEEGNSEKEGIFKKDTDSEEKINPEERKESGEY